MANPLICVFNPITTLIDQIASASSGPGVAGSPVVLNPNGLIDPSLVGTGLTAVAGESISGGRLVTLYSFGGTLHMELSYADIRGSVPPDGGLDRPLPAIGFITSGVAINNTGLVQFSGLFTYVDPNAEFSASDISAEVYLSATSPFSSNGGGITKTRPSGPGQLQQTVGTVVGFTAPNFVQVAFVPLPQPPLLNFGNISTGTNLTATMTVGTGATLTFTGAGVINATSAPFSGITSSTNTTATMTVGTGASIVVSGSGVVTATQLATTGAPVVVSTAAAPTVGQVLTATSATSANWQTPSGGGSPGGVATNLQFNAGGGNFGGIGGSSVTGSNFIALAPPSGTGVSLSVTGDANTSHVIDIYGRLTSGGVVSGTPAIFVNEFGGMVIQPQGTNVTTALEVHGDAGGAAIQKWFNAGVGTPSVVIDFNGSLIVEPQGTAGEGAVSITGDSTDSQDLLDMYRFGNLTAGLQVQPNSDSQGLKMLFSASSGNVITLDPSSFTGMVQVSDSTGENVQIEPFGIDMEPATGSFGRVAIQQGFTALFHDTNMSVSVPAVSGTPAMAIAGAVNGDIVDLFEGHTITATSVTTNVLTVTTNNHFSPGQQVVLSDTQEAFLNGQTVTIATVIGTAPDFTGFTAAFTHADYSNGADTGNATSTTPNAFFNYEGMLNINTTHQLTGATTPPFIGGDFKVTNPGGNIATPFGVRSHIMYEGNTGASPATLQLTGGDFIAQATSVATDTLTVITGVTAIAQVDTTSTANVSGSIIGLSVDADHQGTGTVPLVQGVAVTAGANGQVATINHVYGIVVNSPTSLTAITGLVDVDGVRIGDMGSTLPGGAVSNGLHILSQSGNNLAIKYSGVGTSIFSVDSYGNTHIEPDAGGPAVAALTVVGEAGGTENMLTVTSGTLGGSFEIQQSPGTEIFVQLSTTTGETVSYFGNQFTVADTHGDFAEIGVHTGNTGGNNSPSLVVFHNSAGGSGSTTPFAAANFWGDLAGNDILNCNVNGTTLTGGTPAVRVNAAGTVSMQKGVAKNLTTKTTTYTVLVTDHTINCNGTFTLTLPTVGLLDGQEFYIKNIGTGTVTVSSSVNIDGTNSLNITTQYESITVQWDATAGQYWIY